MTAPAYLTEVVVASTLFDCYPEIARCLSLDRRKFSTAR